MSTKQEVADMKNKLDRALADYQRSLKTLYRADNKPIYAPEEMKAQIERLRAGIEPTLLEAKRLAEKARTTANEFDDIANMNPFFELKGPELERAFHLRPFVAEDVANGSPDLLAARIRTLRPATDRPLSLLYLQAVEKRLEDAQEGKASPGSLELLQSTAALRSAVLPSSTIATELRADAVQLTMHTTAILSEIDGSKEKARKDALDKGL